MLTNKELAIIHFISAQIQRDGIYPVLQNIDEHIEFADGIAEKVFSENKSAYHASHDVTE